MKLSDQTIGLIAQSLAEDIGRGDITTLATIPESLAGRGFVKTKSSGILCGQDVFNEVFRRVDPSVKMTWHFSDGQAVSVDQKCVSFAGPMRSILIAERTALNFIQRMSGIASLTNRYVELTRHTKAKIIDTRKTTPIWREIEKYAVRTGGGANHRMGLFDMFLIKDNHITAAGGIAQAIQRAIRYNDETGLQCAIEVETKNLDEIHQVLRFPVSRIMLDNMTIDDMRKAVGIIAGKCEVEASGGVSLTTVKAIAETGVDLISVGALTHSASAMDLSLLVEKV